MQGRTSYGPPSCEIGSIAEDAFLRDFYDFWHHAVQICSIVHKRIVQHVWFHFGVIIDWAVKGIDSFCLSCSRVLGPCVACPLEWFNKNGHHGDTRLAGTCPSYLVAMYDIHSIVNKTQIASRTGFISASIRHPQQMRHMTHTPTPAHTQAHTPKHTHTRSQPTEHTKQTKIMTTVIQAPTNGIDEEFLDSL